MYVIGISYINYANLFTLILFSALSRAVIGNCCVIFIFTLIYYCVLSWIVPILSEKYQWLVQLVSVFISLLPSAQEITIAHLNWFDFDRMLDFDWICSYFYAQQVRCGFHSIFAVSGDSHKRRNFFYYQIFTPSSYVFKYQEQVHFLWSVCNPLRDCVTNWPSARFESNFLKGLNQKLN